MHSHRMNTMSQAAVVSVAERLAMAVAARASLGRLEAAAALPEERWVAETVAAAEPLSPGTQ